MTEHVLGTPLGRAPANGMNLDDSDAESILDGSAPNDHSLEQVREILFGAQSRRFEAERREILLAPEAVHTCVGPPRERRRILRNSHTVGADRA